MDESCTAEERERDRNNSQADRCTHHIGGPQQTLQADYCVIDLDSPIHAPNFMPTTLLYSQDTGTPASGIACIDIQYIPGHGRNAALTFFETLPNIKGSLADKGLPVLQ